MKFDQNNGFEASEERGNSTEESVFADAQQNSTAPETADAFSERVNSNESTITKETSSEENGGTETDALPLLTIMQRYKGDCLRLGFYLIALLLLRITAQGLSPAAGSIIGSLTSNVDAVYALSLLYSALFLQIIPSLLGAVMLRYSLKNMVGGFHVPKNAKKAFSHFPAIYGAGMTINLLTMGIAWLITGGNSGNALNGPDLMPPTVASSATVFIMLVVIAPVFEEFIFRGVVMNLLKPYGSGIAVFVSAFCFGIFHGNFSQFFYAFALGILLGYISYATDSMFCNTVLHAMFNAISGIIMFFMSTEAVQKKMNSESAVLTDGEQLVVTFYAIFMIIVLITAVIGFVSLIRKLLKIRKYRLPKVWDEVGNGKKMAVMILTLPVMLAVLLMVDVMGENYISEFISGLL